MARGRCTHPISTRIRAVTEVEARSRIVAHPHRDSGLIAKRMGVAASFDLVLHCGACGRRLE